MATGKRKLKETCEAFEIGDEKRDVPLTSENSMAKRERIFSTKKNTPPPQAELGGFPGKPPNK